MTERSSLSDGVKRLRLVTVFAEILGTNVQPCPLKVSGSPFRPKGYECSLIVNKRLMDVIPTQGAWNRGRATGTSASATSCTSLPHQFARRAAGGGGGRSRSAYRDERERNDPHASKDNRIACPPNREEATGT